MRNKIVGVAIAVVAAFLIGFVPQYVKANRLENELLQVRRESAGAELRDLLGLAYVQASQKNYGLAAETGNVFFSRVRDAANQAHDAGRRKSLEDLLTFRDKVSAELSKGDAAVIGDLQDLFTKTQQVTRTSSSR